MKHYAAITVGAPGKVTEDVVSQVLPWPATSYLEVFNNSPYFIIFRFAGKSVWLWPNTAPIFKITESMAFQGQIQATIFQQPDQFNGNLVPDLIPNNQLFVTGYELLSEIPTRREISPKEVRALVPYAVQGASISGLSNRSNPIYVGDKRELHWYVKLSALSGGTVTFGVDTLEANSDWRNLYTSAALTGAPPLFDDTSIGAGLTVPKSFGGVVSVTWSVTGGNTATMAPSLIAK